MGSAKILNLLDRTATDSGGAATNSNNSPKTGLYSFFDVWHNEGSRHEGSRHEGSRHKGSRRSYSALL